MTVDVACIERDPTMTGDPGSGIRLEGGKTYIRPTGRDAQTLKAWSEELGVPIQTLHNRIRAGWTADEVLGFVERPPPRKSPPGQARTYAYQGEEHTLDVWARITGMKLRTLNYRVKAGWKFDDVITTIPFSKQGPKRTPRIRKRKVGGNDRT